MKNILYYFSVDKEVFMSCCRLFKSFIMLFLMAVACCPVILFSGCSNKVETVEDTKDSTVDEQVTFETVHEVETKDKSYLEIKGKRNVNPYANPIEYVIPEGIDEPAEGIEYGQVVQPVFYYSSEAGAVKECGVILPPGYDEEEQYPVLYVLHGFGGTYGDWTNEKGFLKYMYGNMVDRGQAVPMIIVAVEMYTDGSVPKEQADQEGKRQAYDRFVYDLKDSLMPCIESRFSVAKGRENTAIAGISQGAMEALYCTFMLQDRIGYSGNFATVSGVIPTSFYKGTFWNTPAMEDFVIINPEYEPEYLLLLVGSQDEWWPEITEYYGMLLDSKGIRNRTLVIDGYGHDEEFWKLCYYNFLKSIF